MTNNLTKYNQKRDFSKTNEPRGKRQKQNKQLSFVVQHHLASRDHFDFRLEWEGVLLSWAIPKGPSFNPLDKRLAAHVEDHPLNYQDFEGNIPKGQYGGGTVMLWDEGYYIPENDIKKGLKEGSLKFTLYGKRLKGSWALIKMKNHKADYWLLIKHKDKYAKKSTGIKRFTKSIRTNRTMKEIEKEVKIPSKNPFNKANVQLAKLSQIVPEGDEWIYEVKYDGYRMLSYIENNTAKLISRNGNSYNKYFNEISSALVDLADGRSMVLDGEIVVMDKSGKTDFQSLQRYIKSPNEENLSYVIFDLLAIDGQDLRNKNLIKRKEILEDLLRKSPSNLFYSAHVSGNGQENFDAVTDAGLEGLICKKSTSKYTGNRNGDWIKVKAENRQEFVICGYILSKKIKGDIQSLILGYYKDKELIYAGRVGTGFNTKIMAQLLKVLTPINTKKSCITSLDNVKDQKSIIWVKPNHVAEIKFTEWTSDNVLRHPSFKGLRLDKKAKSVVNEYQSIAKTVKSEMPKIELSNKDKIMFKGTKITKEDIAHYYHQVSNRMLPYIQNHLLSLIVCPNGAKGESFFKKHPLNNNHISIYKLGDSKNKNNDYFYINDENGLIYQVQMNAIEFHIWGSSIKNIEKPDILVFDLDPDEGMNLKQVRQGARDLKKVLTSLGLVSFIKTSGGKGFHIVVPLKTKGNWDSIRDFTKNVALLMEEKWPEKYTSNVRKNKRKNKMFIDWMRNIKGATSVAPYSLRARINAPVSMPINWNELSKVTPNQITMSDAIQRLKRQDPWKDFFEIGKGQSIK